VKAFTGDALLVLGSAQSSNTRRLCEVARCRAFRAATIEELEALDFSGVARLGVTSGASTPESFFSEAVRRLTGRCAPGRKRTGGVFLV
jgi:4-hydroxy-3-methylbut-2-enyl diphosphate reductase